MSEQPNRDDAGRFTPAPAAPEHRATEVSDAMSRAGETGKPTDAFEPMKMATPAPAKESTFDDSVEGLRAAAAEVTKRRQQDQAAPTPRAYYDAQSGERVAPTQTRTLPEAAADLKNLRNYEADAAVKLSNKSLSERIDHFRADMDKLDRGEPQADIPAPQPEAAPSSEPANGVDPEVAKALENPKIRAALQEQAMAHENSRQQYLQSIQQLNNATVANMLGQFPELMQGNPQQVLEQMRTQNPQRFAEISGHLQKVQQIGQHWRALQQQQQWQQAQQLEAHGRAADSEFESFAATRPAAEVKAVRDNVVSVLESEFGIDLNTLRSLYENNAAFRSGAGQRLVYQAVRSVLAERGIQKAPANVPRVVRPGENISSGTDNSVLAAAMRAFNADPNNPKLAAKALTARRRAAAGLR